MPYLKYKEKNIYYEVHGEGKPLVIFNGIMMSHKSWYLLLPELSRNNKIILLDFLDQGNSEKMNTLYKQDLQVEVAKAVIDNLGLEKVNIFGISYGGEVAMQFALKYGNMVDKLLLFNTTAKTSPWLRDIGRGWVNAAELNSAETFYNVTIPIIYSPKFYSENEEWMINRKKTLLNVFNKEFLEAMIRLIHSAEGYDITERIKDINNDTLVVSSELDFVTPIGDQDLIQKEIKNSKYVIIKDCGHASMYEKPNEFLSILLGYLLLEKDVKIL